MPLFTSNSPSSTGAGTGCLGLFAVFFFGFADAFGDGLGSEGVGSEGLGAKFTGVLWIGAADIGAAFSGAADI